MSATPVADTTAATFAAIVTQIGLGEIALTQSNAERDDALARLQAILDAGTPTPPPVPVSRTLLGATIDPAKGLTRDQTIANWISKCGPLEVARVFIAGAPTKANIAAAIAPHIGKRCIILSYKGECTSDVLASIPQTPGLWIMLVKYHEPENDGGTHTPAWYRQVQDEEITQIQAIGRDDLKPGFVLMGYADNDPDPATSSTLWFPSKTAGVTLLLDPYDIKKNVRLPQYVMNSLSLWRSYAGSAAPWGIAEMGTQRVGADGAQWTTEALAFSTAEHAVAVCSFESDVNPLPNTWRLDAAKQAAWKAFNV